MYKVLKYNGNVQTTGCVEDGKLRVLVFNFQLSIEISLIPVGLHDSLFPQCQDSFAIICPVNNFWN